MHMLAIISQRLTEPLVSLDENTSLSPRRKFKGGISQKTVEYGSSVLDTHCVVLQWESESMQKDAAIFVKRNNTTMKLGV